MEDNKYKQAHSESEDQNSRNAASASHQSPTRKSASEKVHLKDGPWHKEKENKHHNPQGKSMEEATDPSKLSQL